MVNYTYESYKHASIIVIGNNYGHLNMFIKHVEDNNSLVPVAISSSGQELSERRHQTFVNNTIISWCGVQTGEEDKFMTQHQAIGGVILVDCTDFFSIIGITSLFKKCERAGLPTVIGLINSKTNNDSTLGVIINSLNNTTSFMLPLDIGDAREIQTLATVLYEKITQQALDKDRIGKARN